MPPIAAARPERTMKMVDGSGIMVGGGTNPGGVEKLAEAEMDPFVGGFWAKVRANSAAKGPPVVPPNVPGVQFPSILRFRKPDGSDATAIELLVKVPNTLLPKVRLVGLVVLNVNAAKVCVGMPAKAPVLSTVELNAPIMKLVDVLMSPVVELSAVVSPKLAKV